MRERFFIFFLVFILLSTSFFTQKRHRRPLLIRDDQTLNDIPRDEVVKLDPMKSKKNMKVGKYYLKHKKYDAAIVRFMDAIKYNPSNEEAKYLLIKALYKKGNYLESYNIGRGYLKQKISEKYRKKIKKLVEKSKGKIGRKDGKLKVPIHNFN